MPDLPAYTPILQAAVQHHRAGQLDEAERLYRLVLQAYPRQPDANHNLGAVLARRSRLQEALPYLKIAAAEKPNEGKYWSALLATIQALGARDEMVAACRTLAMMHPAAAEAHYNLANALKNVGRTDDAIESYRTAIRLSPGLAMAHNNLGNLLKLQGRAEDAMASYKAAAAANPRLAEAHFNIGNMLEQAGRLDESEARYRAVLELAPDHPEVNAHLGVVLLEKGKTAAALDAFLLHAKRNYGSGPRPGAPEPASPHKQKHDAEQRTWLGEGGIDTETFRLLGGERVAAGAINRERDAEAVATAWRTSRPQIVVIDGLLTPEALEALRRLCHGSTFWRQSFPNGYLGAVPQHGFAAPVLAQIGEELAGAHPGIFAGHPLLQLWAFKYDSSLKGISLHADFAAVNVNFWITPDAANLDPESGGLVIWDKAAPADWDFSRYNNDETEMRDFLRRSGAQSITVPYRANRAVVFDSDLFHETDRIRFREGYENRRINVTFLYGWRNASREGAIAETRSIPGTVT